MPYESYNYYIFNDLQNMEALLSGQSGTHHCPYQRKVPNLESHANMLQLMAKEYQQCC